LDSEEAAAFLGADLAATTLVFTAVCSTRGKRRVSGGAGKEQLLLR
jgi:hypothetical protein